MDAPKGAAEMSSIKRLNFKAKEQQRKKVLGTTALSIQNEHMPLKILLLPHLLLGSSGLTLYFTAALWKCSYPCMKHLDLNFNIAKTVLPKKYLRHV